MISYNHQWAKVENFFFFLFQKIKSENVLIFFFEKNTQINRSCPLLLLLLSLLLLLFGKRFERPVIVLTQKIPLGTLCIRQRHTHKTLHTKVELYNHVIFFTFPAIIILDQSYIRFHKPSLVTSGPNGVTFKLNFITRVLISRFQDVNLQLKTCVLSLNKTAHLLVVLTGLHNLGGQWQNVTLCISHVATNIKFPDPHVKPMN